MEELHMNEYTLKFTEQELNLVLDALADKPYKTSAPIISSISKQLQEMQAKEEE